MTSDGTSRSNNAAPRHRPGIYPVLVVGLCLAGCTTLAAQEGQRSTSPPATVQLDFARYQIVAETAHRQTLLTGFFHGGATAELLLVHVDGDGHRRLKMHRFDGGAWTAALAATLPREVLFVDLATIGGRDRLLTYGDGRINWFDPESATERPLLEVAASYRATDEARVPHVDITRDLNRDGLDDLVIPDIDGFWVSMQLDDGAFTEATKLGPPEPFAQAPIGSLDVGEPAPDHLPTYGELGITAQTVPIYLSRIHVMDHNRDGLSDLVFWNDDRFEVHYQNPHGFDPEARSFATEVRIDSDGAYSRAFEYSHQGLMSAVFGFGRKTERTVLHSLQDLDADGVTDLVTLTLTGRSLTRQRSRFQVHFGSATPDGTVFEPEVGATIVPGGRAGGMQPWGYASQWFEDFDGDGRVDVLFRDVAVGLGGMSRALLGHSVPIDIEYYRMQDRGYPGAPTAALRIRRFAPLDGFTDVFFPAVLIGDVNGDGRSDLLVGQSPEELHVFIGVPGAEPFAREPQSIAIALPFDERSVRLADLNRDGKQDLVVQLSSKSDPERITLLIAQ